MKNNVVVVVTYGYDYGHVNTLGVYRSMYLAKKVTKSLEKELKPYHYVSYVTHVVGHTEDVV